MEPPKDFDNIFSDAALFNDANIDSVYPFNTGNIPESPLDIYSSAGLSPYSSASTPVLPDFEENSDDRSAGDERESKGKGNSEPSHDSDDSNDSGDSDRKETVDEKSVTVYKTAQKRNKSALDRNEQRKRNRTKEHERRIKIREQFESLRSLLNFKGDQLSTLNAAVFVIRHVKEMYPDIQHLVQNVPAAIELAPTAEQREYQLVNATPLINERSGPDYKRAFRHIPVALAIAKLDGVFIDCTNMFTEVCGLSREQLATKTLFGTMSPSELQEFFTQLGSLMSGHQEEYRSTRCYRPASGEPKTIQCSITIVRGEIGGEPYFNYVVSSCQE